VFELLRAIFLLHEVAIVVVDGTSGTSGAAAWAAKAQMIDPPAIRAPNNTLAATPPAAAGHGMD